MNYFSVRNWERFQHYKNRTPPWIKLHRDLLRDYEFTCLQDASKLHLILIWLLASQMDNRIPADPEWLKVQLGLQSPPDLKALQDAGFIECDSELLAPCKQSAIAETETETETETEEETDLNLLPEVQNSKAALEVVAYSVIDLPLIPKDGTYGVTEKDMRVWSESYPAVDVMAELRKMVSWLHSNPTKRKTKRGIKAFVNTWLSKAQDRSGNPQPGGYGSGGKSKTLSAIEALEDL